MSNDYVGVPNGYQVQQGSRWDVSQINNPSSSSYGRVGTRPIMGAPTYRPSDLDSLFGKGPQQVGNTQKLLYALGYLKSFVPGTYDDNTRSALEQAMTDANRNGITLEQMYANRGGSGFGSINSSGYYGGGGGGGGGGSVTSTSTSKSYTYTSRATAQQILSNALTAELGRQATPEEVTRFLKSLNAMEKADPSVSTSTSTSSASGSVSSSTSTSSKVNPSAEAEVYARKVAPKAHAQFEGANLMSAIASMIGM